MKQLLQSIQTRLQTAAPLLKHIDRDWGQMFLERPPVRYPCALLSIAQVEVSQWKSAAITPGHRLRVTVTVAIVTQRITGSSAASTHKNDTWLIYDAAGQVINTLTTLAAGFTPLTLATIDPNTINTNYETLQLTFVTTV
jgi:hypothetical protein